MANFYDDALHTVNRLRADKQELMTALETAYEVLLSVGAECDEMIYIEHTLYKFDSEEN